MEHLISTLNSLTKFQKEFSSSKVWELWTK